MQQVLNNINQAEQRCTEVSSSMSYNNNFYMGWVYGWGLFLIHVKRFFSWCSTFHLTQYTSIPKFTFYSDSENKIHSLETMKCESANANYPIIIIIIIYLLKAHLRPRVIVVVCFYFESLYCLHAWSDWLNAFKLFEKATMSSCTRQLQMTNFINIHRIYTK